MQVEIINATAYPMDVVALCAGICYGKLDDDHKRVKTCFKSGHMSVFEHVSATFLVRGISRACSHQLVRHRLASYSQESQRYTRSKGFNWYVKPKAFSDCTEWFDKHMNDAMEAYEEALSHGVKPEDARFLLPQAAKTKLAVTMNARELFHFLDLRQDSAAQWEIRELAKLMEEELAKADPQWDEMLGLRHG